MRRPVILDVDTGNDDAVAVVMAALHPGLDLLGCTTVAGNLPLERTTDNTLQVLDALGRLDIEVHAGLSRPYAYRPFPPEADSAAGAFHQVHLPVGKSGHKPTSSRGIEWMIETLRAATDPVTLIPLAPLSNIAAALTVAPDIRDSIDEVILMGGGTRGNRTAAAEFNIYSDPVAADVVLRSGIKRLVMTPLDATNGVLVHRDDLARYREMGTRASILVADVVDYYLNGYETTDPMGDGHAAPMHDAICIAYAVDPSILELRSAHVSVDTVSPFNYGRTTVDFDCEYSPNPNALFAVHADQALFHKILDEILRHED